MAKICMLVTSELHIDPRVQKEALIAHDTGHQVTVVCREFDPTVPAKPLPYTVTPLNIARQKRRIGKVIERIIFNLRLIMQVIVIRPDIIHANDFDTLPAAYIASLIVGARVVYDSHELWNTALSDSIGSTLKRITYVLERYLSKRVDKVVTVSEPLADILSKNFAIPKPLVVHNAPYFHPIPTSHENQWQDQFIGCFVIMHQGRYGPDRHLDKIILAAHYLPPEIKMAFRGIGSYGEVLRDITVKEGLTNRVAFLPPVPMNDMIPSLWGVHLGIVGGDPAYQGNVSAPNKLFEYIMAGVPFVAPNLPAMRGIVGDANVCRFHEPGNPEDIARQIIAIYENPEEYHAMQAECKKYAKLLSWEVEGKKLVDLYETLL